MSEEVTIPIVQEEAHVFKRAVTTDRVTVRTGTDEYSVTIRDELVNGQVLVARVPMDRQVDALPPVRTEGDVTIIPIVEERLIVEKRLFLIEELHLTRQTTTVQVAEPVVLRRTRVDIDRQTPSPQETY